MPFEFTCPQCQKSLRVPDGSAGKDAKCPNCGSLVTIPEASAPSDEPQVPSDVFPALSETPLASASAGFGESNPYASPADTREHEFRHATDRDDHRSGPPWESEGQSFDSYFKTVKLVFAQPAHMFGTMRRTANLGAPMAYGVIGSSIGAFFAQIYQVMLEGAAGGAEAMIGMACSVIFIPVILLAAIFISAGITHLMLMMLDGAKFGFHTTFRVIAYSNGTTGLVTAIPIAGGVIGFVMQIVYSIIGLSRAHEISGGKAALAVLVPTVICCGLVIFGIVMLFAMWIPNASFKDIAL